MKALTRGDDLRPPACFVLTLDSLPRAPAINDERPVLRVQRAGDAEAVPRERREDLGLPLQLSLRQIERLEDGIADKPR